MPQYLFKFKLKGTALKGIFNFTKTILPTGTMKWHLSPQEILFNDISSTQKTLFIYKLKGINLLEYRYNFKTPTHSIDFEIKEMSAPISSMKISDTLKVFISDDNPNIINLHIIDREGNVKRKKIRTLILQDVSITDVPNIFSNMPVNLEPETFQSFMKMAQTVAKTNDKKIMVKIQSPDYISFSKDGTKEESQSHGKLKKKKAFYMAEFEIDELKHVLKLLPCTNVLGLFHPTTEDKNHPPPIYIRGNVKNVGEFEVYIHRADVDPIKEIDN